MVFIKFLNLGLIFILCIYLGFLKAKSYDDRVVELSKFQNSLVIFKSKIEFTYEPIRNIFSEISKLVYENNQNIFDKTIKSDGDIFQIWNEAVSELKTINLEDKEIIKSFGKFLGKTDIKGQVSQIELSLKLIEKQIEKAEIEKCKNYKLFKSMGVIAGMTICIILV